MKKNPKYSSKDLIFRLGKPLIHLRKNGRIWVAGLLAFGFVVAFFVILPIITRPDFASRHELLFRTLQVGNMSIANLVKEYSNSMAGLLFFQFFILFIVALVFFIFFIRARKSLRVSEERSRRVEIISKTGNWEFYPETNKTIGSEGAMKLFGLEIGEFKFDAMRAVLLPEFRPLFDKALKDLIEGLKPYDIEFKIKTANTEEIKDIHAVAVFDKKKRGIFGILIDITEHKHSEDLLRVNMEHKTLILRSLPIVFYTALGAENLATTWISEQVEQLTGFPPERFIEDTGFWTGRLHPDDREKAVREFNRIFEKGTLEIEYRWMCADGSYRWFFDQITLSADYRDNPKGIIGIWLDITERKHTEQKQKESDDRFRSLFDNAAIGLYRTEPSGRIIMANPTAIKLVGYNCFEELAQRNLEEEGFEPSYSRSFFHQQMKQVGEIHGLESSWIRRDGTVIYVRESAKAVQSFNGEILYYEGTIEDITERIKVEEALRKSELDYQRLFDHANDVIFIFEPDNEIILEANIKSCQVYGFKYDELVGMSLKTLTKNISVGEAQIEKLVETGDYHDFESIHFNSKGEEIYFLINSSVIDYKGRKAILSINRDITERKRIEEALNKERMLVRALMDNVPELIYFKDLNSRFIDISRALAKKFHLSHPLLAVGKTDSDFFTDEHANKVFGVEQEIIRTGKPIVDFIEKETWEDGSNTWVSTTKMPLFNETGNIIGTFGISHDITANKHAEEALRNSQQSYIGLFNTVVEAIYIHDRNGFFIDVNAGVEKMYGYKREEVIGKTPEFLAAPGKNDLQYINDLIVKTFATGEPQHFEFWGKRKNGEIFPKEVIVNKGVFFGKEVIVATARDVTDRKQAEENLVQLNFQLNELNATKDKLFSIIAHDLRSPFNSILGFSELLCKNIGNYDIEKSEKFIRQINTSAKHTYQLLENLLAWAKAQTHQMIFKPDDFHLQPVIQEIINLFDFSSKMKGITISNHVLEDLMIHADQDMMKSILRNLISNAIKFTYTGGRVDISAISYTENIEITIADNGLGMSVETQIDLFSPETYITTSGTANEKGSGLGLLLCKEFVEKHDGKIWVESELGKGTSFHFTFPKI